MADEYTYWTNVYRCMHGVPDLLWSADVAQGSEDWAKQLYTNLQQFGHMMTQMQKLHHGDSYGEPPPRGPAGENIAGGSTDPRSGPAGWYDEVYDCDKLPGCMNVKEGLNGTAGKEGKKLVAGKACVGHFTAMIWKSAETIGCARNRGNVRPKADQLKIVSVTKLMGKTKIEVHAPHGFLVGDAVQMGNLKPWPHTECVKRLSGIHRIEAITDKVSFIVPVDITSCDGEVRVSTDLEWPSWVSGQTPPFHVCRYKAGNQLRPQGKHGPAPNFGRKTYSVENVPVRVKSKEICSKEVAGRASKMRPADAKMTIKGTMVFTFEETTTTTSTTTTSTKAKGWVIVSDSRRRRYRDPNFLMISYVTEAFKNVLRKGLGAPKVVNSAKEDVVQLAKGAVKAPEHGDSWSVDFSLRTTITWEKTVSKVSSQVKSIKLEDFNTALELISKKRRYPIPSVASMKFTVPAM